LARKVSVKGPLSLSEAEFGVWGGFLAAHSKLARQLDEDLRREHGMPLTTYDLLVNVVREPGRRMRMSALAEAVHFSLGGMTKLVARLESEGLVRREPDPTDGRAALVVLTDEGERRFAAARAVHLDGVRRYFLAHLSAGEMAQLREIWARVLGADPLA
jgi:DNA-binding MarR family transcriptional regulator